MLQNRKPLKHYVSTLSKNVNPYFPIEFINIELYSVSLVTLALTTK